LRRFLYSNELPKIIRGVGDESRNRSGDIDQLREVWLVNLEPLHEACPYCLCGAFDHRMLGFTHTTQSGE
jgi:hypothetical protein